MSRIFLGWWVLFGLFITYTASNGILISTLPLFYPELIKEFGWNEAQVTLPATLFFLGTAVMAPVAGYLVDRWSARIVMVIGVIIITVALGFYPFISSLAQLNVLHIGFAFGLALGGLLPSMLILTRWFVRYRGISVGILLMASSFGGAIFPLIIRDTLVDEGWRAALLILAIAGGVMMILPLLLWVRSHPRDANLHADGGDGSSDSNEAKEGALPTNTGLTLKEAVKLPVFYLLAFATATLWFCIIGMLQHQSIYLGQDLAIDMETLPLVFSVFFWCAMFGKFIFGFLSDHFNRGHIMLLAVINLGIGLIIVRMAESGGIITIYAYAAVYGAGYSGAFTMIQLMIAEFFAGHAYGKILGVFIFIDTVAGALGTRILGEMRVAFGSYIPGFNLMIALCAIASICIIVMNQLNKRASHPVIEST